MPTEPHDPPTLLRDTLADLGIRQNDLARRCGLTAKHVNRIAQGEARMSTTTALAFERATGVPALTWLTAQAREDVGARRQRPRVWWSGTDGVVEQMVYKRGLVRYLVVTGNRVVDDLPQDAVELIPADPAKDTRYSSPVQVPSRLVDEMVSRLQGYYMEFGPNTLGALRRGGTRVRLTGGEREYLARIALAVARDVLGPESF